MHNKCRYAINNFCALHNIICDKVECDEFMGLDYKKDLK